MGLFGKAFSTVSVGQVAPDFELEDQHGERVRLGDLLGQKNVVLYFYPKDDTPGCTVEACTFRDSFEDFVDAGAYVVGVSSDSASSHRHFVDKHHLPFRLLADPGGQVRKRYGVPKTLGLFDGRVTFVIDRHGTVRHVFGSQSRVRQHVAEALRVLRELN